MPYIYKITNNINKLKTKLQLRRAFAKYQREKAKCAKLFPDWVDNEYNYLYNKFIWGFTIEGSVQASFATDNIVSVYYNRNDKSFYLSVDATAFDTMDVFCSHLHEAFIMFQHYLSISELDINQWQFLDDLLFCSEDWYRCSSLEEVLFKLKVLSQGLQ